MLEQINKTDAPLYIDVTCYACQKSVALSNSEKIGGRDMCSRCATEFHGDMNEIYGLPAAYKLLCVGCNKTPQEISEYVEAAEQDGFDSADAYVRSEEGTLNTRNGHFLCTECYVNAGCPSSPQGWVAP